MLKKEYKLQRGEKRTVDSHLRLIARLGIVRPIVFDVGANIGLVSERYINRPARLFGPPRGGGNCRGFRTSEGAI